MKALELLDGVISPELHNFLKCQIKLSSQKPKGCRYDDAFKAWALNLYHISGKSYRFLAKLFHLPTKRTLTRMVSRFASEAGFSEKSLYVVKERIASIPESAKICSLMMDEMSLKSHLFYDISNDHIVGLEDYGSGENSGLPATSALVLMVRGVLFNWKQPIAYFLVNESSGSSQLKKILAEALNNLESLGLDVVSVVSDQGSNFLKLFKTLGVTEDRPFFYMQGKKYFTIFDPPHLLKSVRNNLMKYDVGFDGKVASSNDIKSFFEKDQKLPIRVAPKLTDRHLNLNGFLKMKVKLASQVFSHSVAAGISTYVALNGLPDTALGTAQFVSQMDTIFDCCNSLSFQDPKFCRRPFSPTSPHLSELKKGIRFFSSLKFFNRATGEDRTDNLKCLTGWKVSLKAILSLWEKLYHEGIASFLVTRQLNQDPLENFFGSIRQQGGNNDNPTPVQFKRAYRKLFHSNLLHVASGNCEEDKDEPLTNLSVLNEIARNDIHLQSNALQLISPDYRTDNIQSHIISENAIAYVAGYLLRKTSNKHKCDTCGKAVVNDTTNNIRHTFLHFKSYEANSSTHRGLIVPSESMLQYVVELEDQFVGYFSSLKKTKGVGNELLDILDRVTLQQPCASFAKKYLLMLFIRMRIYYCLKFANRELKSSKRKNRKYLKIVHL